MSGHCRRPDARCARCRRRQVGAPRAQDPVARHPVRDRDQPEPARQPRAACSTASSTPSSSCVDARAASVRLATGDGRPGHREPPPERREHALPAAGCAAAIDAGRAPRCSSATARVRRGPGAIPGPHPRRRTTCSSTGRSRPWARTCPICWSASGRHLGLAIEKSRLESEARRLAIMEERNIIGNELHDSLAQSLIGMRLQLKMLSESLARKDLGAAQYEAKAPAARDDAGERGPARPAHQLPPEDRRIRAGADGREPGRALPPRDRHRGVLPERVPRRSRSRRRRKSRSTTSSRRRSPTSASTAARATCASCSTTRTISTPC